MHASSLSPWPVRCYPIPNRLSQLKRRRRFTTLSFSSVNLSSRTLSSTNSCSRDQENKEKKNKNQNQSSSPHGKYTFLEELYFLTEPSKQINTPQVRIQQEEEVEVEEDGLGIRVKKSKVILTNMWWVDFKAALGQRFNFDGIVYSVLVIARDRRLAIPSVSVPNVRHINWAELRRKGFRGVVFDKDNTITAPYALTLWGPLESSLEECKSVFGNDIAVFSNSAGLNEYDPDGSKARTLEKAIGIKVLRHRVKKPAGSAEEIQKHFGCSSSQLIMVGDRPFMDIVYGNRNGFLTILTEPLSLAGEPSIVKQVRRLEVFLMNRWCRKGLKPISHCLLPDALQCVKEPAL